MSNDRGGSDPQRPTPLSPDDLRLALSRICAYARALEQRCDRLWTYVPDTHGQHDPALPFVASACEVSALDLEAGATH